MYGKNQAVANRWERHCKPKADSRNRRLECAIREHGAENFTVEVVDKADNREMLGFKERFYIGLYDSFKNGYNGSTGGTWFLTECSAEHRHKLSVAGKGNTRALGYKHTEEEMQKILAWAASIRKTYCLRGHERTPESLNKHRDCKQCAAMAAKARRARKTMQSALGEIGSQAA